MVNLFELMDYIPHYDWAPHRIYFRLAGDELRQVIRWQQMMDLEVMRYQIETQGSAVVIRNKQSETPHRPFQHLKSLPEPGEALPWYGWRGSIAYSFSFRAHGNFVFPEKGSTLRVVNESGGKGHDRFPPEKLPPLELEVPDRITIEAITKNSSSKYQNGPGWGWWYDWQDDDDEPELIFEVGDHLWRQLNQLGWNKLIADGYTYKFIPTSVGMEIILDWNIGQKETLWLTESICW